MLGEQSVSNTVNLGLGFCPHNHFNNIRWALPTITKMAEQKEPPQGESCQSDQQEISSSRAAAALLMAVQSKSKAAELVEFKEVESPEEGKNKLFLVCDLCKCKVLQPGYARLVEKEVST